MLHQLEPVVYANKYMLKPIDQSNEASMLANNGIERRFPEPPYQGKNIPVPKQRSFGGAPQDSDDECDCNLPPPEDDRDPRRYIKERERQEHEYIKQQNRYRSRSGESAKEHLYRDEYVPHKYEGILENEDKESYQVFQSNLK